ncbi:MAG: DUF3618 domain-containing protein [Nocardioidaceae bacterium]
MTSNELEAEIAATREDLAQTVDQLAAKLDVRSRVRHRVEETKDGVAQQAQHLRERATDDQGKPTPVTLAVGSGMVTFVAVVLLVTLRRRRAARRSSWPWR